MKPKPTSSSPGNKSFKPLDFINKGNIRYANSTLHALSTVPLFWSRLPSESSIMSPNSKATTLNFCGPLNARFLIFGMYHLTSTPSGMMLKYCGLFFRDLKMISILTNDLLSNALKTTITCDTSLCSAAKKEKWDIFPLPMSNKKKRSFDKLLHSETPSSQIKLFCPSCDTFTESTRKTTISNSSSVLIVQLTQFSILVNRAIKDKQFFDCFPNSVLKVPMALDDEVSFTNKYSLVATINQSGSLDRDHYWAFIKDAPSKHWFSCNDRVILNVNEKTLSNSSSYVYFSLNHNYFSSIYYGFLEGGFVCTGIISGYDDPIYNLS